MKELSNLVYIFILVFFTGATGLAQNTSPTSDTLKTPSQSIQAEENKNESAIQQERQLQASGGNSYGKIKRIRSSRPDMSRARGARPPSIVRPSGSGIPKGVGKPAGVGRKGGR